MIDPIQTAPTLPSTAPTDTTVTSKTATGPAGVAQGVSASGQTDGADASTPTSDAPLRLSIIHDKATNRFVYQLYDAGGKLVKEIPQESLAEAQKQAAYSAGDVISTSA
jgi:hypothetical protein